MAEAKASTDDVSNDKNIDINESGSPDFEIIDDTPEEDRGKEPLKADDDPEPPQDELENYSDKVQNRIGKLKKAYHDERRVKEAKEREAAEAYKYAKAIQAENVRLKKNLSEGENVLVEQSKARADAELAAAKGQYKKAYEEGDSDKVVAAQEKMTAAAVNQEKWNSYTPKYNPEANQQNTLQNGEDAVYNPSNNVPKPDAKAEAWFKENTWFGNDEEMTALAYGLHEKLVKSGIDPRSDAYYERINTRMRQVFPDKFNNDLADEDEGEGSPRQSAPANVVAPVKRSPASKKIRLTQTQVALAKRLGVPLDAYAKQVAELNK